MIGGFAAVVSVLRRDRGGPIFGRDRTRTLAFGALACAELAFGIPTSNYINRNIVRYRTAPHGDYIGKKFRNAVHVNWTKMCLVPVPVLPFLSVVRPRSAADRADRRA